MAEATLDIQAKGTAGTGAVLSPEEIAKQIKPLSGNAFLAFFQKAWRAWLAVWYGFSDKHPKLSKLIYQIVFFFVFSIGVTVYQYLVLLFLPMVFGLKLAGTEFIWPKVFMYNAGGQDWFFSLLGTAIKYDTAGNVMIGGGLGHFIAYEIAVFTAQCINFPLQRNITFRSHGNPWWQAMWYFIGWVLISLFCNAINSLWFPIANGAVGINLPVAVREIITMFITGGISMVIFFFIFLIIFPDYNVVEKRTRKKLEKLKAGKAAAEKIAAAEAALAAASEKARLASAEKARAKTVAQASSKAMAYFATVKGAEKAKAKAAALEPADAAGKDKLEKVRKEYEALNEKIPVRLKEASDAVGAKDAAIEAYKAALKEAETAKTAQPA